MQLLQNKKIFDFVGFADYPVYFDGIMKLDKSLYISFSENHQPTLQDQFLYIPVFYQNHADEKKLDWTCPTLFPCTQPVIVEYCSGNGEWIVNKAVESPHLNWVAVEKKFGRAKKIWLRAQNKRLSNVGVVCSEALCFSRYYISDSSLSQVYVNFPDPWPKRRHGKHRLIGLEFLQELSRCVKPGGEVAFVTDDLSYSEQAISQFTQMPVWKSVFNFPHYVTEWPFFGASFFDTLWRQKKRVIRYHRFTHVG